MRKTKFILLLLVITVGFLSVIGSGTSQTGRYIGSAVFKDPRDKEIGGAIGELIGAHQEQKRREEELEKQQMEEQRSLEEKRLAEHRRQFDQELGQRKEEFNKQMGQRQEEFDKEMLLNKNREQPRGSVERESKNECTNDSIFFEGSNGTIQLPIRNKKDGQRTVSQFWGIFVEKIHPILWKAGIRPGDVIFGFDYKAVHSSSPKERFDKLFQKMQEKIDEGKGTIKLHWWNRSTRKIEEGSFILKKKGK